MSKKIVRIATTSSILLGVLSLSGCNTWKGFGKDVESTGESIQGDKSKDQSDSGTEQDPDEDQGGG